MAQTTKLVRVPREIYETAVNEADRYGVTIGDAIGMMTKKTGDATGEQGGVAKEQGGETPKPVSNDTPEQPSTTQETGQQVKATDNSPSAQGDDTQAQASDPKTSSLVAPAAMAAAPVAQEIVVKHQHHHLIEDARDPERVDRLEQHQEEQQEINAHVVAGVMANKAALDDHLGQHAEGRRKIDADQSQEAGRAAYRNTYAALAGMNNQRAASNVLRHMKQLAPPDAEESDEPDYDAAA